jgi:PKD repeat protein
VQSTKIPTNVIIWNLEFSDGVKSIDQKPKNTYYAAENDIINLTINNVNSITSKDATIIILKQAVYSEANFSSYATSDHVPFSVKFTG